MSRVFVTHTTGRIVFDPAARFGRIVHMFPLQIYPDLFDTRVPMAIGRLKQVLVDFNPERDYLLPSGDPLLTLLAGMILGERHPRITLLHWDRQAERYFPVDLNLKESDSDQGNNREDSGAAS